MTMLNASNIYFFKFFIYAELNAFQNLDLK